MSRKRLLLSAAVALLGAGCRKELHVTKYAPVEPPVTKIDAIPDAPVSGTLRGASFRLKDARYVVDHRMGYERVDIKLSAGAPESACGPVKPSDASMVWLRREKSDELETQELHLDPSKPGPWSVHYQVHTPDGWVGSAEGYATVTLRASDPDGKLSGGLSVCFSDDQQSCVSGSFDALPCPWGIDKPVRGALVAEAIPEKYRKKWGEGGSASSEPAPSASASAAPSASASASPKKP